MIQRQVQLHGSFLARPCCPGKHLRAQRHHTRIDTEQLVLKSEFCFMSQFRTADIRYPIKNVPEQFPRTMSIRIRQCGTLRHLNAELLEATFTTGQSSDDFSQRLRIRQLTKQHGHKMIPTCEAPRMPLRSCITDVLMKFVSRKNL